MPSDRQRIQFRRRLAAGLSGREVVEQRDHHASSIMRLASARSSRMRRRNSAISRDRPPWVMVARCDLAKPAAVLGPVDAPPCIRQRPFRMGRFRQGEPPRVRAPQAGGAASDVVASHERF